MASWIRKAWLLLSFVAILSSCGGGGEEETAPPETTEIPPEEPSDLLEETLPADEPEIALEPEEEPASEDPLLRPSPPETAETAPPSLLEQEALETPQEAEILPLVAAEPTPTEDALTEEPLLQKTPVPPEKWLIPYHTASFRAVPHGLNRDFPTLVAADTPLPLAPLSHPLGREEQRESTDPVPPVDLALLPDRKEEILPPPAEKIDPPDPAEDGPVILTEPQIIIEPEVTAEPETGIPLQPDRIVEPEIAALPEAEPEPDAEPALPGPLLTVESPGTASYYRSSILLKGQTTPSPEAPEETRDVKSVTWRIDALGDYDNTIFLEEDGSFELDVFTAGLEGPHTLVMKTEDFGGRTTRRTIRLNDGNQPPRINLEFPAQDGSYGSMLAVRGTITDIYEGIAEVEGVRRLSYRLIPRDRNTQQGVVSGEAVLGQDQDFFFALDMVERDGRQSLILEAEGENGAVRSLEILLTPGSSDIPSFAVKPQDGRLILSWDTIPGADEQTVYLTDDGSVPSPEGIGNQFSSVKSPLVLGGVMNGRHYRARLKVESGGIAYWSDVTEAVPLAPGTLELTAEGRFEQVLLRWKAIPGASAFRIYRREENETEFTLLQDPVKGNEYVDAAVDFGRSYYYRIEPSGIAGPLSYEVPAAALEAPSEKITMSSHYREITPIRMTVSGEYAYVAAGDTGFYIMDVSVPQKPEEIGHLDLPDVKDVYIEGEYAYLASGSEGFHMVNIAEPTRPYVVVSRVTDDATGIVGQGDIVYVADGERGLQIFDASDRQEARRISSLRDFPAYQLALKDERLYVASGGEGLKVLDVSVLSSPALLAEYSDVPVFDVLIRDNRLYIAGGEEGMIILEEDSAGGLVELSRFRSDNARMVRLWEDYAMIADGSGGLKAVDISLPDRPRLFGSYPGQGTESIAMAEDYALIADVSGLKVVRTYLYGQSVHELSVPTAGRAYSVLVDGSFLWVADRRGGVAQYDISNPLGLSEESLLRVFPAEYAEDILLMDNLLYVADGPAGLKVFDRDSAGEEPIASIPVSGRARRVLPYGSSVVVISTGDGLMFTRNNQMTGRVYYRDVRDAAFYGSYLFVGDFQEGLIVMDAGGTGSPFYLETFREYQGIRQLMIKDDTLYVLHREGISFLDIRNPERPVLRGEIVLSDAESMQMAGRMLYVAEGFRGVGVYRISEDYASLKVSDADDVFAVDAAPSGGYVYYADMDGIGLIRVLIPEWLQE